MIENIPVSIIVLDSDLQILRCNSFFTAELRDLKITCTLGGSILKYIPDFFPYMERYKTIMNINKKTIYCTISHYLNYIFIENIPYTKNLVRFSNTELKPTLVSNLEDNMLLSKTKLTQEQIRYNEQITKNNVKLLKTVNNITEYLKISSGLLTVVYEDISIQKVIDAVKKIAMVEIKYNISRDVILNTDFKKLVEMFVHILQHQIDNTIVRKKIMEVKLVKDTLIVEITDTTSSLSKYQKETLFHGFIHNDVMTDQKSLIMPIAKGLSMSLGGNLEIIDSSKGKTVYRFKIMTKDSD